MVASNCHAGRLYQRWDLVVADDIDPYQLNDVSGLCTRCDRSDLVDIINGVMESALDRCATTRARPPKIRVVSDACIPFGGRRGFQRGRPLEQSA